ncbi:MAG: peptidoglycan DD-metalloendopeptidase family protein, partial [Bacteroidia bacterium]|nr:peptidoglycan DD-metalloendopeptidase family protein [Bacteroidia bacterium]
YGGYGNYIRIWHKAKGEFYTCYGHLSGFKVSVGDYVSRGDLIALHTAGAYGQVMAMKYNQRDIAKAYYSTDLI